MLAHGMQKIAGAACKTGESPLWAAGEGAWYWVDIPSRLIWRQHWASGALRSWALDEMAACIAVREGGGLIAGMESGIFSLDLGDGLRPAATLLAAPDTLGPGKRFNDGRCDRQGRFWSGTMFMDMAAARADGHLYRYDGAHGLSAPVVSGLLTQNGLAWSPDGRTMYLSDSHPAAQLVWAFDFDTDTGVPSNRRVFVDMNAHPGRPDGATVDTDGCYWTCANDAGLLLRFTPQGVLDRTIELPMSKPSMCAFGGDDLQTLLVTSIVPGKPDDDEWDGSVIAVRPGAQGVPDTPFRA